MLVITNALSRKQRNTHIMPEMERLANAGDFLYLILAKQLRHSVHRSQILYVVHGGARRHSDHALSTGPEQKHGRLVDISSHFL